MVEFSTDATVRSQLEQENATLRAQLAAVERERDEARKQLSEPIDRGNWWLVPKNHVALIEHLKSQLGVVLALPGATEAELAESINRNIEHHFGVNEQAYSFWNGAAHILEELRCRGLIVGARDSAWDYKRRTESAESRAEQAETALAGARQAALEEAAKVAENSAKDCCEGDSEWHRGFRYAASNTALLAASNIRALTAMTQEAGR